MDNGATLTGGPPSADSGPRRSRHPGRGVPFPSPLLPLGVCDVHVATADVDVEDWRRDYVTSIRILG